MLKFISIILLFCALIALSSCDRAIPTPGSVIYTPKTVKRTIAPGYLVGKTMYMKINNATGSYRNLKNQRWVIVFKLDYAYRAHEILGRSNPFLIDEGTYHYALDYYHLNESMLNLVSKRGIDMTLTFSGRNSGTFAARSSDPKYRGRMTGSFVMRIETQ